MTKKQTQSVALLLLVVVVFAVVWFFKTRGPKTEANPPSYNQGQNKNNQSGQPNNGNSSQNTTSTWEGTLKVSDNAKKGNLMLVTGGKTIYLQTTRNFSALIGKQVVVSYQGSPSDFTLLNISAK